MERLRVFAAASVVAAGFTAFPTAAHTQSLVEVAELERERRQRISEPSRVYTNDDLRGGRRLTTARQTPTETAVDTDSPTIPPPATDAPEPEAFETRDEAYWRSRIGDAREERRRAELMAAALQNRIDGLWADFTARDDPVQRAEIERNRATALAELERARAEVQRWDAEISTIQEEARRLGVPPGFLR